jgi:hypothetical protein
MKEKIAFLVIFAAAMAFVEAAVVVYLRDLLGGGPIFPMKFLSAKQLAVEIGREGATVVMLLCVASLPFRGGARRMGAFLLAFAAWDVFYYLWLRVTIGWPAGIADWDVLFLIPLPWVGPVWSVLLICAGMLAFSVSFLRTPEDAPFAPGLSGWTTGVAGSLAVIATYILEWRKIGYGAGIPEAFSFLPFLLGILLLAVSGWTTCRKARLAPREGS